MTYHRVVPTEHGSGVTVCGMRASFRGMVTSRAEWRRTPAEERCHGCDLHHERADKATRALGRDGGVE